MARAPEWFPAWLHMWVRLSAYAAFSVVAAILAHVCAHFFGGVPNYFLIAFLIPLFVVVSRQKGL